MKTLNYKLRNSFGEMEIILTVSDEDYDWIRLLFARNKGPFKALKEFGYDVEDKDSHST